jgi:hypothetical protein
MVTCCGLFGAVTWFTAQKVIQGSPVFAEALAKANSHPNVTAALGQPVAPGGMVPGESEGLRRQRHRPLTLPIEEPKGKGTLYVEATKTGNEWTFTSLKADVGHSQVELLAQPSSGNPLPQGGPSVGGAFDWATPPVEGVRPDDAPLPDDAWPEEGRSSDDVAPDTDD